MRINHKQEELINNFLQGAIKKYPNIKFVNLSTNPDDPEHIWINVTAAFDDAQEIEYMDYEAETEADIHLDYGYRISMMLENTNSVYA